MHVYTGTGGGWIVNLNVCIPRGHAEQKINLAETFPRPKFFSHSPPPANRRFSIGISRLHDKGNKTLIVPENPKITPYISDHYPPAHEVSCPRLRRICFCRSVAKLSGIARLGSSSREDVIKLDDKLYPPTKTRSEICAHTYDLARHRCFTTYITLFAVTDCALHRTRLPRYFNLGENKVDRSGSRRPSFLVPYITLDILPRKTTKLAGSVVEPISSNRSLLGPDFWVYGGVNKKPP
ncbi:hypothetical protein B0T24DRAFT_163765 [Lasiosphaeria ovina]|uniref:Uncharacterized protein n=1 Tax=Lasiosphaeria ovina TaxID=92902 RepID=A0AAE0TSL3_9PEZI|nr:hypothetical protein B0T24DRAFT_163765 [Lasiosphaeria ovina]